MQSPLLVPTTVLVLTDSVTYFQFLFSNAFIPEYNLRIFWTQKIGGLGD